MSEKIRTTLGSRNRWTNSAVESAWHTAAVLLLILIVVILSMIAGRGTSVGSVPDRMRAYIVTIVAEWLIVAFIGLAARTQSASAQALVGQDSLRWRGIARDLGLAVAFMVVANTVAIALSYLLGRLMHPSMSEAMKALLPKSRFEVAAFLLLAFTASICEEIIFRGYLQRQFTAWTKSVAAGIVIQGVAFGLAHTYQGSAQVVVIAVYGCLFGLLAHWRGSLRPGMAAHFLQDGIGGLLVARFLMK